MICWSRHVSVTQSLLTVTASFAILDDQNWDGTIIIKFSGVSDNSFGKWFHTLDYFVILKAFFSPYVHLDSLRAHLEHTTYRSMLFVEFMEVIKKKKYSYPRHRRWRPIGL
jgi:hypothetical protein